MDFRVISKRMLVYIMAGSLGACTCHNGSDDAESHVECSWNRTFIRVDEAPMVMPQYMFFCCNVRNRTADTLNWHYLGFNQGYFGELSSAYASRAYLRLKTGDSLRLYQESYEAQEMARIAPHDSLRMLFSLDDFYNVPAYAFKSRFDSIESLIEDIVYYTGDVPFRFHKSADYEYIPIETTDVEEGDGTKTTIPIEVLNEKLGLNKKSSIDRQVSTKRTDTIESFAQAPAASLDTIIQQYVSYYSKGDTTIGDYKLYCQIRPNGEYLPVRLYGDTLAYMDENTELLLNVNYKDSVILSTVLTREKLKENLEYPEDIQKYAMFNVWNFNVDKDTLKLELTLCIPDTDLDYIFELAIANDGALLIKDITEKYYTNPDGDI